MDYLGLTSVDQYFGDGFADRLTLGDRLKMTLALGTGADSQIGIAKGHRLTENRRGHSDGFIEGKCPNERRGRIRVGCEMVGELDPGFQLNHGNKGLEHLVE